ncbi:MAG: NUDIX domain-containing protein [Candidatus Pacebacteria bacterium]|nr:NUDIX domain-containing protein [Candidatus Paceibacterota bacterium]
MSRPTFPVGANVFVIKDGKLLLGKRKSSYHDSEWGLPGGHVELREKILDAAKRELEEETGLVAEKCSFVLVQNDIRQDDNQYIHFGLLAENVSGTLENKEPEKCYEWEYFPLDALPTPIFIGHEKLIAAFLKKEVFSEA